MASIICWRGNIFLHNPIGAITLEPNLIRQQRNSLVAMVPAFWERSIICVPFKQMALFSEITHNALPKLQWNIKCSTGVKPECMKFEFASGKATLFMLKHKLALCQPSDIWQWSDKHELYCKGLPYTNWTCFLNVISFKLQTH